MKTTNSNLESGIVMNVTIVKFRKVKANEQSNYRGKVNLKFSFEYNGTTNEQDIEATVSSLCGYHFYTSPEKYVGKTFSSKNTSPSYQENPFMVVKSEGKYYLYIVYEGGKKYVDVIMPGGITVKTMKPIYKRREQFVRFLDADALRREKPQQAPQNDTPQPRQGAGGYSRPVAPQPISPAEAFQNPVELPGNTQDRYIEIVSYGFSAEPDDQGYHKHPDLVAGIASNAVLLSTDDQWNGIIAQVVADLEMNKTAEQE